MKASLAGSSHSWVCPAQGIPGTHSICMFRLPSPSTLLYEYLGLPVSSINTPWIILTNRYNFSIHSLFPRDA